MSPKAACNNVAGIESRLIVGRSQVGKEENVLEPEDEIKPERGG